MRTNNDNLVKSLILALSLVLMTLITPLSHADSKEETMEKAVEICRQKGLIGKKLDECVRQITSKASVDEPQLTDNSDDVQTLLDVL